ncbi:MAG: 2-oxo-4-hydroxy-4-carboxy-5-ureidoimidazoline decarboxylase [Woeseia sp.]|nr:2-oxo-4-hydroxy-4-carboxy-5-ureidoimidazoline decarboxylase [Woeseia sp.]MBT6210023.1 2-oxo-4-hydroxy-4-carboxy-5-ureidoimidazoline decarboxylase [Woeseia sp.]
MSNDGENEAAFVARYGGIYEHSAWVAEQTVVDAGKVQDIEELATLFAECVDNSSQERRLALIKAHPDLAGRAAIAGELTEASNEEQASAGIDQCSPEEFARFQDLNERYKAKFDFPFVMAVRNSSRHEILAAFETRLSNDQDDEFEQAIAEIHKIARLRLAAEEQQ